MGCDIHLFVEKKNKNGTWSAVKGISKWDIEHGNTSDKYYEGWLYDGRNYRLFSLLADVRNGIRAYRDEPATGHEIEPISKPKGLPCDCSDVVKHELSDDFDIHSRTYYTLKELQNINWDANCKVACLVGADEYKQFKKTGCPNSGCGGSSAIIISNKAMDRYLYGESILVRDSHNNFKDISIHDDNFVQTLIEFNKPISYMCDIRGEIKELEELLDDEHDNENIRIIMGFDN